MATLALGILITPAAGSPSRRPAAAAASPGEGTGCGRRRCCRTATAASTGSRTPPENLQLRQCTCAKGRRSQRGTLQVRQSHRSELRFFFLGAHKMHQWRIMYVSWALLLEKQSLLHVQPKRALSSCDKAPRL